MLIMFTNKKYFSGKQKKNVLISRDKWTKNLIYLIDFNEGF